MKSLLASLLILSSVSAFAQAQVFIGLDQRGDECSVLVTPTANPNVSDVIVKARDIEVQNHVKGQTPLWKILGKPSVFDLKFNEDLVTLRRNSDYDVDRERKTAVRFEDGRPVSFKIVTNLVKVTFNEHKFEYGYSGHPGNIIRQNRVENISTQTIECDLQ